MRDSDLDNQSEPASEEEVLAPRPLDSLADRTPAPVRRAKGRSLSEETTKPLLVGTALTVVALGAVVLLGGLLVVGLWALR